MCVFNEKIENYKTIQHLKDSKVQNIYMLCWPAALFFLIQNLYVLVYICTLSSNLSQARIIYCTTLKRTNFRMYTTVIFTNFVNLGQIREN